MSDHEVGQNHRIIPGRRSLANTLASRTFVHFPYLITRLFPALYNINLLPRDLSESELVELARAQVAANKLQACLVFGWNRGLWFDNSRPESEIWSDDIPHGGILINGGLKFHRDYLSDPDIAIRSQLLDEYSQKSWSGGYLVGDPENCVREAAESDTTLGDISDWAVPKGLSRCNVCGELKGECFDGQSELYADKVWHIRCKCENDNICAACNKPLNIHRLDSCYYNERTNEILHVAGYLALKHRCDGEYFHRP